MSLTIHLGAHKTASTHLQQTLRGLILVAEVVLMLTAFVKLGIVETHAVFTVAPLMVVALSERAYTVLKRAFKERTVDKTYHALVQGLPDPHVGTVDAPIGRHPSGEYKFAVMDSGKHAITHYELLEAFRHASLLEIKLETGRTHQIRVHMAAQRHPDVIREMVAAGHEICSHGYRWIDYQNMDEVKGKR